MSAQPPAVRASDAERERTVDLLRTHAGDGRLSLEELAQRIDATYASRTREELETVTADLPLAVTGPGQTPRRGAKRLTGVVFGSVERKGRWRLPRRALVFVGFGDADIDLRLSLLAISLLGGPGNYGQDSTGGSVTYEAWIESWPHPKRRARKEISDVR